MNISRRGFLGAILTTGVAPFVVKAESLMAVRVPSVALIVPDSIRGDMAVRAGGDALIDSDISAEMMRQIGESMALTRLMIAAGVWERDRVKFADRRDASSGIIVRRYMYG